MTTTRRIPDWLAMTLAVLIAIGMVCGLKWAGLFPGLSWWEVASAVPVVLAVSFASSLLSLRR